MTRADAFVLAPIMDPEAAEREEAPREKKDKVSGSANWVARRVARRRLRAAGGNTHSPLSHAINDTDARLCIPTRVAGIRQGFLSGGAWNTRHHSGSIMQITIVMAMRAESREH